MNIYFSNMKYLSHRLEINILIRFYFNLFDEILKYRTTSKLNVNRGENLLLTFYSEI